MKPLNIFYQEPDRDRWFKYDRYPRRIIRRIIRGPEKIGGVKKWFLNLIQGLDVLGYPYKINNFKSLRADPEEIALVIGKPQLIEKIPPHIKIIYGPALASHPSDNSFWSEKNIIHILASCQWLADMYRRDLPQIPVSVWPSGIETDIWKPLPGKKISNCILVYDKIRWEWDYYNEALLKPILKTVDENGIQVKYLKYGSYQENDFAELLKTVDAMIFLCEHETQGFAYQQALSCNVPILAWNRKGYWQDPDYFPDKVKFAPVSSVPYWNDDCGMQFEDIDEFHIQFPQFIAQCKSNSFKPRKYILDNLTLEKCAAKYVEIVNELILQK